MASNEAAFDWRSFIRHHPLFGDMPAADIDTLLDPEISTPRAFERDDVIFRAGEIGNSFFLIGEGSVNVELSGEESSSTIITTLYRGDYFGEMSAIDSHGGRAATIIAIEDCRLLEIKGKPFQKILKSNPELEFELLSMLTARLRQVNDHLLNNTRLSYDTKFSLLAEKIESQSKVVDASLNASRAVFEQTKIRTSEIIDAAERGRTRITWVLSSLTAGFTLLLAVLSFLGYERLNTAQQLLGDIDTVKSSVEDRKKEMDSAMDSALQSVDRSKAEIENSLQQVNAVRAQIAALNRAIADSNKAGTILFQNLIPVFMLQVERYIDQDSRTGSDLELVEPRRLGEQILEANNDRVTIELFKRIFIAILDSHKKIGPQNLSRISYFTQFMYLYIHDEQERRSDNPLARFLCNYLLLLSYALDEDYARDNNEYSDINPAMYPRDGYASRRQALEAEFRGIEARKIRQLDEGFVALVLDALPGTVESAERRRQLESLLN